jgi:hypothetical protein
LPVLLLVPSERLSRLDAEVWDNIDEVIGIPARSPELKGRINVLLRLHRASKEAHRHAQEVRTRRREKAA